MKKTFQSRADGSRIQNVGCKVRAVIYPRNNRVKNFLVIHSFQINFNAIGRRAVKSPSLKVGIVKAFVFDFAQNTQRMRHSALLIQRRGDCHFMPATFQDFSQSPKSRAVYPVVICQ